VKVPIKSINIYKRTHNSSSLPKLVIGESAAESVLKQITGQLLAHNGFDCKLIVYGSKDRLDNLTKFLLLLACHGSALCLMTDIGIQYFQNLGKTLRLYLDKYQTKMSFEVRKSCVS
jgi:hypothetical protein